MGGHRADHQRLRTQKSERSTNAYINVTRFEGVLEIPSGETTITMIGMTAKVEWNANKIDSGIYTVHYDVENVTRWIAPDSPKSP